MKSITSLFYCMQIIVKKFTDRSTLMILQSIFLWISIYINQYSMRQNLSMEWSKTPPNTNLDSCSVSLSWCLHIRVFRVKSGTYTFHSVYSREKSFIPKFVQYYINNLKKLYVKTFSFELHVPRQSVNFCSLNKYYFCWKPISLFLFSKMQSISHHMAICDN